MSNRSTLMLGQIFKALGQEAPQEVEFVGADPVFPLALPVGEAGAATIAASGVAAADLWQLRTGRRQDVSIDVDAAAAAMRSANYLRLEPSPGQKPPVPRVIRNHDIYRTKDGRWLYLHREFAHHRARIAQLLRCADEPEAIAAVVSNWQATELEDAVFQCGACAGLIRSYQEWDRSDQGRAVAGLPLLSISQIVNSPAENLPAGDRPLSGIRVLDLTRVLAGPTCARTLAEHGADVLRIGAAQLPNNERHIIDTGHGKRSAVLDLDQQAGLDQLCSLVGDSDVFSQSYRPGSMAARGFSFESVAAMRPGIIYVSLSAFGPEGPWRERRGFDTLVQTVSGISHEYALDGKPRLLPVSALDYMTGYLAAFGALVALGRRAREGGSYHVEISLAQTAHWLTSQERCSPDKVMAAPEDLSLDRIAALSTTTETPFGRLQHLAPAVQLRETPARWERPAVPLDHDQPGWL
ncbi:MAG TPA: CoA transferase [Dehalococcoidia bacterium]|nr:CoA transferase [Dehalococcoidia bacterium]